MVQIRVKDWTGNVIHKKKRGFDTKREAQQWERDFINQANSSLGMSFKDFIDLYMKDMEQRLKSSTVASKHWLIDLKITPFFGKMPLNEIKATDVRRWQNSLTGEIARMLLPLSFLARVSPTPTHRRWLRQAVDAMIAWQQPCGAIRDAFGDFALGKYPPPQSHERYGTSEASLIQENGDPATDLLYTANWAFIGFWEASRTLGEASLQPYEKLRDFLIRTQVRSGKHPELDGAWMRGFDYEKWEYWGSTADIGWSAWSIESGWVNAWIATTLILEERGESLMRLSPDEGFRSAALTIYREMMTPRETRETVRAEKKSLAGSAE